MDMHERDFDFLFGTWSVQHRRLRERLMNSSDWEEFDGTSTTRPILDGHGNVEENFLNFPQGAYRAIALRSFSISDQRWAIWWLDERRPHSLDVPVIGQFEDGIGTFLAHDAFGDLAIKVRFQWSHMEANSCQWQQAFSTDNGASWETNWIMNFTRDLSFS